MKRVDHIVWLQCLALGAQGVLVGRPIVYGLAIGGQAGVDRVVSKLKRELRLNLQLMGCPSISQLSPDWLISPQKAYPKL